MPRTCAEQMRLRLLNLPRQHTVSCEQSAKPKFREKKDQLTLSNQQHVNTKFKYLPRDNKLRHWWFLLCYDLVDKPVGFKYCF